MLSICERWNPTILYGYIHAEMETYKILLDICERWRWVSFETLLICRVSYVTRHFNRRDFYVYQHYLGTTELEMFAFKYFIKNCLFKCLFVHHLRNGVSRNHSFNFSRNKPFKFPAQGRIYSWFRNQVADLKEKR